MNTFHTFFQKGFVFLLTLCFMFVAVYVPQYYNKNVNTVEAGWPVNDATNIAVNVKTGVTTALSFAKNVLIASYQAYQYFKELIGDGLVWAVSKALLASITSSIVNWINGGFKGSPMFVQDITRHLLHTADHVAGEYLEELGGLASFICAPFQLDIQIALAASYRDARSGALYGTCSLTGALENIDNFVKGAGNFITVDGVGDSHGWDTWYTLTSQPGRYTTYGNLLEAQGEMSARIINARGEEINLLSFGQGFMSSKLCKDIKISGVTKEQCEISTPGQVIEQALNFQLSSGSRSLIVADEVDEILGALFGQLIEHTITGAAGLLGLSEDTGTEPAITPRLEPTQQAATDVAHDDAVEKQTQDLINATAEGNAEINSVQSGNAAAVTTTNSALEQQIIDRYTSEVGYRTLVTDMRARLSKINEPSFNTEVTRLDNLLISLDSNIAALTPLHQEVQNGITRPDADVIADLAAIPQIGTLARLQTDQASWTSLFVTHFGRTKKAVQDGLDAINTHYTALRNLGSALTNLVL